MGESGRPCGYRESGGQYRSNHQEGFGDLHTDAKRSLVLIRGTDLPTFLSFSPGNGCVAPASGPAAPREEIFGHSRHEDRRA